MTLYEDTNKENINLYYVVINNSLLIQYIPYIFYFIVKSLILKKKKY
jgi:hypothetical protein